MIKTALVDPPEPDWVINPLPLLGTAILKTFLESNGYKIETVDLAVKVRYLNRFPLRKIFNLKMFDSDKRVMNFLKNGNDNALKKEIEKMIELGCLDDYDVLGFNFIEANIRFALCIAKVLKEKYNKKIVFGSALTSRLDLTHLLNLDFIDFLIVGDGEKPLLKILRYYEGKDDFKNYNGISYKKDGKIHKTIPSIFPLKKKALPTYNVDDLKLHKRLSIKRISTIPYLLSVGCKFKCAFCFEYRNTSFAYVPLDKVISDLKLLLKKYNANFVFFAEGNFNNNKEYVKKLSERIIKENLDFSWGGFATITELDENTIQLMAKSGCRLLMIGAETGSESVSAKMNLQKKKDVEIFKKTLRLLHDNGIRTHNFYIVEFPYETSEDFQKTLDALDETSDYVTTTDINSFQLLGNTTAAMAPLGFRLRIRKSDNNRSFLHFDYEFDEIEGLKWEEKYERGQKKAKIVEKIAQKKIRRNIISKILFRNPVYLIKRKILCPYPTYDVYFV